jgi:monothiol glutaredoxin
MDTETRIKSQIEKNPVLLYMKGSALFPQCGFSAQVAHIMELLGVSYSYVNILENLDIRQTLPKVAQWPTFPQLYIKSELVGGCDIVTELYESGDLSKLFEAAGIPTGAEADAQVAVE